VAQEEGKPGGRNRRAGTGRRVIRGGNEASTPPGLAEALEAAGIDVKAFRQAVGPFNVPWDAQASRQAAMAAGTIANLRKRTSSGDLAAVVERDPALAPAAMARWLAAAQVCMTVVALYGLQGTAPAPSEDDEEDPAGDQETASREGIPA